MTQLCRGWGSAARVPGELSVLSTAVQFGITARLRVAARVEA
jgi:hypothetical protein